MRAAAGRAARGGCAFSRSVRVRLQTGYSCILIDDWRVSLSVYVARWGVGTTGDADGAVRSWSSGTGYRALRHVVVRVAHVDVEELAP